MQPAQDELAAAIEATTFSAPNCPIYQNVDALAHADPGEIQQNLVKQLDCAGALDTDGAKYGW